MPFLKVAALLLKNHKKVRNKRFNEIIISTFQTTHYPHATRRLRNSGLLHVLQEKEQQFHHHYFTYLSPGYLYKLKER